MLRIKDLTISYATDTTENVITHSIDMQVKKNEIVCIVGESGCGKTSILKSIIGLLPESATINTGDILYNNESILNKKNKLIGEEIAMVFQDAGASLNPVRKIGKQFIQYIKTHRKTTKKEAYELAVKMLEKMHLNNPEDIMNSYAFQLSGGMRQRVGLAIAMSLTPSLLLLDEPTSALDVTTQAQVIDEIKSLKEKYQTTILMITHNIPLAIYVADYLIIMQKGKIVEQNKAVDIFKNPAHEYTKELLANIPHLEEI